MQTEEYDIQLYRGPAREFYAVEPFLATVRQSLQRVLHRDMANTRIMVRILNMPEEMFGQVPSTFLQNLIPEFGYVTVRVFEADDVGGQHPIYQHPHLVSELVTDTLEAKLRRDVPEGTSWAFRIDIPGMPRVSTSRPAPEVQDAVHLEQVEVDEPPFAIRRLPQPALPARTLEGFGRVEPHRQGSSPVNIVISTDMREALLHACYAPDMEDGGFLIGQAYQDPESAGRCFVHIRHAIPARYSGASLMHFVFTCDSFADFKCFLRQEHPDERILGWYHTHLFAATEDFGLSWFDVHLHHSTFTIPWQIAGLVNIDGDARVLRFYAGQDDTMVEAPCWVVS